MKKREAFKLAKKFREDHPELADRPVRTCWYPSGGYDACTVVKLVPRGPRGGMGDTVTVATITNGTHISIMYSGDTVMTVNYGRGLPAYDSRVVLPHDECGHYASHEWQSQFTTEEQIESVKWAIANLPADPETPWELYDLDEMLHELEIQLEHEAEWASQQEDWEHTYAVAMES